ncbi:MAG: TM2 domain-containing protein [Cyanobacteria bacterium REEB459]|nr:TM2 domain-containing protein [Cyanobacteria bacterium REEB459]
MLGQTPELNRRHRAVALAWLGALAPGPIPLSGLHKFYLGQPVWGVVYLLLGWTQIPRVACAIEGFWLLSRPSDAFKLEDKQHTDSRFEADRIGALGVALRELDRLRQEGLISELEFEQKRRYLLEQLGPG